MRAQTTLLTHLAGGTVTSLTCLGETVLAATPVGVFRAASSTLHWESADAPAAMPDAYAVATALQGGTEPTAWAGTQDGLYRSTDAGRTWARSLACEGVPCVTTTGTGAVLAGTASDGVVRSTDGGDSWTRASSGLLDLSVTALLFVDGRHGPLGLAGTGAGLYLSYHDGRAWRLVESLGEELVVEALAAGAQPDGTPAILAATTSGLLHSNDEGASWHSVAVPGADGVSVLAFAGLDRPQRAVLAAGARVWLSEDAGLRWSELTRAAGPILAMAFLPGTAGRRLVLGLAGGGACLVIIDGGASGCEPVNDGLRAAFVTALAASAGGVVTALTSDCAVLTSVDGGSTWDREEPAPGASGYRIALAAGGTGRPGCWVTTSAGLFRRGSGSGWRGVSLPGRCEPALALTPADESNDAGVLTAVGSQILYSTDDGRTWSQVALLPPGRSVVDLVTSPEAWASAAVFVVTRGSEGGHDDESELWLEDC